MFKLMSELYMRQNGMGNKNVKFSVLCCLPFLLLYASVHREGIGRVHQIERLQHHQALLQESWKEPAPSVRSAHPVTRWMF